MTDTTLAKADPAGMLERVIAGGDLSKLSPADRLAYYMRRCESLGLNPYTQPFEYILLNNKLTLYARKDCADQLRNSRKVSIGKPDIRFEDDWIIVTVEASTPDGRTDSDIGVVNRKDMGGAFGNALMKAVTKAKRRVTLSICGLGMLDETEIDSIPDAKVPPPSVAVLPQRVDQDTGEIHDVPPAFTPAPVTPPNNDTTLAAIRERRAKVMERWETLWAEAQTLGIKGLQPIAANIPLEALIERGRALADQIAIFKENRAALEADELYPE